MPWSGGTFTRVHDWTTDAGASLNIEADRMDAEDDNFSDGINDCLHKSGQNTAAANLPMGGNRHTAVGNASSIDDYASAEDVIDQHLVYYLDSGAADVYVITPSPAITAYAVGQKFSVRFLATNTGASTLNVNGLGAISIVTSDKVALIAGAILTGAIYEVTYDSTGPRFQLTSPAANITDAALSANVPLLDATNTFTSALGNKITSANPRYRFEETGGTATEAVWQLNVNSDVFSLQTLTDAYGAGNDVFDVTRTGTTVDVVNFQPTTLQHNGTAVVLDTLLFNSLADPGADSILFWDDTGGGGTMDWMTATWGLEIDNATKAVRIADVAVSTTVAIGITSGVVALDTSSLTSIEGNALVAADTFLVDDGAGGTNKTMSYGASGIPTATITGTTDTLTAAEMNHFLRYTHASGCVITLNDSIGVTGNFIVVYADTAAAVTFAGSADIEGVGTTGPRTTDSVITLYCRQGGATAIWVMYGDST